MPGISRVVAPDMPHHVVQRGHNRNVVFVDDGDYSYYLDTLGDWSRQLQVKVYAWISGDSITIKDEPSAWSLVPAS
jgi:putative transposase